MRYTEIELSLLTPSEESTEAFGDMCAYVSSGGTLPEWCQVRQLRFGVVAAWVNQSPELLSQYSKATMMRAEWFEQTIFSQLRSVATLDIRQAFAPDGSPLPVDQWPDDLAKAIGGLDIEKLFTEGKPTGTVTKLKLLDKLKAIELLMRNRKMLTDRTEVTGKVTLEQLVELSRAEPVTLIETAPPRIVDAPPHPGVSDSPAAKRVSS